MRQPRFLAGPQDEAWYHVFNRAAGPTDLFPFRIPEVRDKLLQLILFYVDVYCCHLAGFILMDNHYHLLLLMEPLRPLLPKELEERARRLYGHRFRHRLRTPADWLHFNNRLFSLSQLMRNINGRFTEWYNPRYGRRGPFWADRFKSVWLADPQAVQDNLLYLELNANRAGLVRLPEHWPASSARLRRNGQDQDLLPLSRIFLEEDEQRARHLYRMKLLYRGMEPGRPGQASIPEWIVRRELQRGFPAGVFRQSLPLFTNGVVLGTPGRIEQALAECRRRGLYRRRRKAVSHLGGLFHTLRATRPARPPSFDSRPAVSGQLIWARKGH